MTAPIEVRDVSFHYGRRVAVDGVSLAAERGEFVGVIGPNGSGKSTLLRLLSGIFRPLRGGAWLDGCPLEETAQRQRARRIAVVTQEAVVDFPFSVTEVVLMGRAPHLGGALFEGDHDVEVARRAMARTRILDLADRFIDELSGGERQRVILARALAQEAPILLLDEPTAFLDIRHQVEVFGLLRDLRREGYTIIAAVHDLNLAAAYCDRLALLKDGRLLAAGPAAEVLTAAHIRAAYEIDVEVTRGGSGALSVTPSLPLTPPR
jgi:iron complex transport system ATP-binding protein